VLGIRADVFEVLVVEIYPNEDENELDQVPSVGLSYSDLDISETLLQASDPGGSSIIHRAADRVPKVRDAACVSSIDPLND
jgi:hypothetical protein